MKSGIDRQYEYEAKCERERDFEVELTREEIRKAERVAEDAYLERSRASYLSGESEEAFELREAAAIAEGYRVTERANADVLALFARCAPAWRHDETLSESLKRRAA